jgi:hypothetical protein
MKACPVCVVEHNEEIHQASLRVRAYLRSMLEHIIAPEPEVAEASEDGAAA